MYVYESCTKLVLTVAALYCFRLGCTTIHGESASTVGPAAGPDSRTQATSTRVKFYLRHERSKLAAAQQAQSCTFRSSLYRGSIAEGGHHHVCNSNSITTNSLSCCRVTRSDSERGDLKKTCNTLWTPCFFGASRVGFKLQLENRVCGLQNSDGKVG